MQFKSVIQYVHSYETTMKDENFSLIHKTRASCSFHLLPIVSFCFMDRTEPSKNCLPCIYVTGDRLSKSVKYLFLFLLYPLENPWLVEIVTLATLSLM